MSEQNDSIKADKVSVETRFGEWQTCPLCNGQGEILADGFTSSVYQQCPTCSGNRIIQRPLSPSESAGEISELKKENEASINEIGQLREQLKEAQQEIRELNRRNY